MFFCLSLPAFPFSFDQCKKTNSALKQTLTQITPGRGVIPIAVHHLLLKFPVGTIRGPLPGAGRVARPHPPLVLPAKAAQHALGDAVGPQGPRGVAAEDVEGWMNVFYALA